MSARAEIHWDGKEWELRDNGVQVRHFPLGADAAAPKMIVARFPPDARIEPHTHDCNYAEYIVEGSQRVGKTDFGAGTVRVVPAGTGYGPLQIGPEGCTVVVVFENGSKTPMIPLPRRETATSAGSRRP